MCVGGGGVMQMMAGVLLRLSVTSTSTTLWPLSLGPVLNTTHEFSTCDTRAQPAYTYPHRWHPPAGSHHRRAHQLPYLYQLRCPQVQYQLLAA